MTTKIVAFVLYPGLTPPRPDRTASSPECAGGRGSDVGAVTGTT
jgi:hypothetical protein